jgi:hypothetical protein
MPGRMAGRALAFPWQAKAPVAPKYRIAASGKITAALSQSSLQPTKESHCTSRQPIAARATETAKETCQSPLTHLLHHIGGSSPFSNGYNFENGVVTRFLSA